MKYRCPYCGEETFSFTEKAGFWIGRDRHEQSIFWAQCSLCRNRVGWFLGKTKQWGHLLFVCIIPVVITLAYFYLLWNHPSKDTNIIILVSFPLWIPIWFSLNYFFCHFDKRHKSEREADARIKMSVSQEQPLWPAVKKGEIYLFKCPERGTTETAPHLIAMVVSRKKSGNHREMELRVIKAMDMALPYPNEPIWLITRGKKVIEGITLSATLAKEVPEIQ